MKGGQLCPAYLPGPPDCSEDHRISNEMFKGCIIYPAILHPLNHTHHKYDLGGQHSPLRSHSSFGVTQPPRLYHFQASLPGALNFCRLKNPFSKKIVSPCDPHREAYFQSRGVSRSCQFPKAVFSRGDLR